ncbi:MAG: GMC family oxidoreductase [Gemmobacter sp.]
MDGDFDFIIVGAGSAGCVLAERLSASGRHRVLLVEAGGSDRRLFVQMPLGYGKLYFDPAVNWGFRAEPDPGLGGQADYWPRGRILGGSSAINAMVWCRGHPEDYEDWRRAGNPGWGWDEALAAYREIEDFEGGADTWRGSGGPLHISTGRNGLHPLVQPFLDACAGIGLPFNPDMNGASQEGAGIYQLTVRGGRRNSAARAFLEPARRRPNLAVLTGTQVMRILFEEQRAAGIEYRQGGRIGRARSRGEVVLSAGAIGSPQILMLSGVGPAAALARFGIGIVADRGQVGANLADHQGLNYTWRMRVPTLNQRLRPWWGKLSAGAAWLLRGTGPLARSINEAGGFFRTDPALPRPNMQLYMQAFSTLIPRGSERPVLHPDPFPGLSLGLSNCRPTSLGRIELRSPDPFAPPLIHARAFATDHDVTEMLAAVKVLRRIAAQPALAELIEAELRPGPDVQDDAALIADFRARSGTVYHPCGTCRMGADPAQAVVNPDLRVHGVDRLRVCDASVFPNLIAGNTNAPAILVAWLGAGRILAAAP